MLSVKNISKQYGKIPALKEVSFEIADGEFFSLLGPNGAGKTTTINIISSLIKPDSGKILLNNTNLYQRLKESKMQMGVVPQEIALYNEMNAWDNLMFWGKLYNMNSSMLRSRALKLLEWTGLSDRKNDLVSTYSGGMKRRLNIAAALMHDPQLIIMDEPTVGIDPQSRTRIYSLLETLHTQGKTILYTTHYMEEAEKMSSRIGIIDNGKLLITGTLEELKLLSGIKEAMHIRCDKSIGEIQLPDNIQSHYDIETKTLNVFCRNLKSDAPLVMKTLIDAGTVILNMEVQTVNLEDIFLKLTGSQLRE